jgi:peptidyl-prolyl cis-trans isomerase C
MRNLRTVLLLAGMVAASVACTKPATDAATPAAAPATTAAATPAVATVNGKEISAEMYNTFLQAVSGKPVAEVAPEMKSQMLDQLINMMLAAQAAEKDGLDKSPEVKARADLLHAQILAEAASDKYIKAHPVSESEVRAEYDTQVAAMPKEYKARHILVETKELADSITRELAAGGDFAKLAKSESKDPGSAKNGGELGWFSGTSMVKPFSDAVAALQKGETTKAPVQTQYGWHVIQLEDVRTPEPPKFEDVQKQVEQITQRKKLQSYLDELRKTAQIQKKS